MASERLVMDCLLQSFGSQAQSSPSKVSSHSNLADSTIVKAVSDTSVESLLIQKSMRCDSAISHNCLSICQQERDLVLEI